MNILYLSINFPSKKKGDSIYTDLLTALFENGHDVVVYTISNNKTEMVNDRGYPVYYVKSPNYFSKNFIKKGISFLVTPKRIKKAIQKYNTKKQFDLILCDAPPITMISTAKWLSSEFNAPIYLMQKDIFPENAADIGIIKKNSLLYHVLKRKESKYLSVCDYIGTMSPKNTDFLIKNNDIKEYRLELFPNTIDTTIGALSDFADIEQKIEGKYLIGAIGNLGKPQYVCLLIDIALFFKDKTDVLFIFAGRGTELNYVERMTEKLGLVNVLLIKNPNRAQSDFLTSKLSIGLITLDPNFTIPNFPSRVLSYMKFGVPVISSTDKNTDFGYYVENVYKCGFSSCSDNLKQTCDNITKLISNETLRRKLGESGYSYLRGHLSVRESVAILERHFFKKNSFSCKKIKSSEETTNIADIHISSFPDFFLTSFGKHFLRCFYHQYLKNDDSGIYGAYEHDKLIGFLAYCSNNKRIAKMTVFKHPFSIGFPLLMKVVFSKKFRKRFSGAFSQMSSPNNYIYFSSLAVSKKHRGIGVGSALIQFANTELEKGFDGAYILTDYKNNNSVIEFYAKNGFDLSDVFERKDGRKMALLIRKFKK